MQASDTALGEVSDLRTLGCRLAYQLLPVPVLQHMLCSPQIHFTNPKTARRKFRMPFIEKMEANVLFFKCFNESKIQRSEKESPEL